MSRSSHLVLLVAAEFVPVDGVLNCLHQLLHSLVDLASLLKEALLLLELVADLAKQELDVGLT